jgi:hypothetical protein
MDLNGLVPAALDGAIVKVVIDVGNFLKDQIEEHAPAAVLETARRFYVALPFVAAFAFFALIDPKPIGELAMQALKYGAVAAAVYRGYKVAVWNK